MYFQQKDDGMKILFKFLISIILLPAVSFAVPMFSIIPNSSSLNLSRNETGVVSFTVTNSIGTNISSNITYTANIAENSPFQSSVSPSSTCGASLLKGQSCQLAINVQAGNVDGSGFLLPRVCYRNDCSTTGQGSNNVLVTVTANNLLTFTTCGATGAEGPSMTQCNTAYVNTALAGKVSISGKGIQHWTVPTTGIYRIEAFGAQGASGQGGGIVGGLGADMRGDFMLTSGLVLDIVVGQMGVGQASGSNGGGGGGSFVVTSTGKILVIAGGGGGTRSQATVNGFNAVTGMTGGTGFTTPNGEPGGNGPCAGGVDGNGGVGCPDFFGSGGGGYSGNGSDSHGGTGGMSFIHGAVGGLPILDFCGAAAPGGFGGGGAGNGCWGGGGGGGYSGGGGGYIAGGGASFNSGTNQSNTAGVKSGDGLVTINYIK